MMVTKLHRSSNWFVSLALLILLTDITIARTVSFHAEDRLFVYAVLFDFMLVIPFLYWLCVLRKNGKPFTKAFPLPFLGAIAAWLVLPVSARSTIWQVIWPVELLIITAEVIFIGYEIRILYRFIQHFLRIKRQEADTAEALRISANEVIGEGKLASIVLHDVNVFYYLLFSWRRKRSVAAADNTTLFTYHRKTGQTLNAIIVTKIILFEGVVVHLLLQQWSHIAAWILTIADIWLLALIWADSRASVLNPVQLKAGILRLRYGMRIQAHVSLDDIDVAACSREYHPDHKEQREAALPLLTTPNVRIQLKQPVRVDGFLFLPRNVSTIYLALDEPERFVQTINQIRSACNPLPEIGEKS